MKLLGMRNSSIFDKEIASETQGANVARSWQRCRERVRLSEEEGLGGEG